MITITTASFTTFATTPSKMSFLGNTLCDNKQSNNKYAPISFLLSKSVFGNKIFFGKTNESVPCMIPNLAFVKEVDDNDNNSNFEYASRVCILSIGDNKTWRSVMGRNVAALPSE